MTLFFIFIFIFFPGLAYWNNPCMEFHARWFKTRVVTYGSAFWGPHDGWQNFRVQIPQKLSKMVFYKHVRASANRLKTNDVTEDWRHWLAVARGGRAAYIFIASWKLLRLYLQRNNSVSWCTIFGTEIQFLQNVYIICRQSNVQVGA